MSEQTLAALLSPLTDALRAHLDPARGLMDPDLNAPTPADHYGQTATALALLLSDGPEGDMWRWPLRAWNRRPVERLGHAPFNRFLLLLMSQVLGKMPDDEARSLLDTGLRRSRLARRYPSNNWTLLAQLCRILEAPAAGQAAQVTRFVRLLDRWTAADGAFIDYPARPRGYGATPMTYHHKALLLTAVAAHHSRDSRLTARMQRLLDWLPCCWDGGDGIAGFGRSNQALFADACLLAALALPSDLDTDGPYRSLLDGIRRRLDRQRRPDRFYSLNPACQDIEGQGWDAYMALTVYNAWFAALLAWASSRATRAPVVAVTDGELTFVPRRRTPASSGLLRLRSAHGLTVFISTHGQPPQAYARSNAEFRYAGGVPFAARIGGHAVIPAATRVPVATLLACPAHAGWTPVIRAADRLYGLTDFDVAELEDSEQGTRILLNGQPIALTRSRPRHSVARLLAALDWRWFGGNIGRHEALNRPRLAGVDAKLSILVMRDRPAMRMRLALDNGSGLGIAYLNPIGHSYCATHPPCALQAGMTISRGQGAPPIERALDVRDLISVELDSASPSARAACLPAVGIPDTTNGLFSWMLEWSHGDREM